MSPLVDGPNGELNPTKDVLLNWIFELSEHGHDVDCNMVVMKASVLLPDYGSKSDFSKYKVAMGFLNCFSLVYHMGLKDCQCPPKRYVW